MLASAAAIAFALGPADVDRTTHVWQPDADSTSTARMPLVLVAGTPESLSVTMPCRSSAELSHSFTFSTAQEGGLVLAGVDDEIAIRVGTTSIATVPWRAIASDSVCTQTITYEDSVWTATDDPDVVALEAPGPAPTVTRLEIEAAEMPIRKFSAEVTTQPHGSSPSAAQWVAGLIAIALAVSASVMALAQVQPQSHGDRTDRPRPRPLSYLRPADGVVVLVTLAWLFIGPAFYDDGWIVARHGSFEDVGRFTDYYSAAGAGVPFGYWNDWLGHWWTTAVSAPIALRIMPFVLIIGGWFACRAALAALAPISSRRALVIGTLSGAYLVGATSWLMTLRPEPMVALLCALTISGVALFHRRGNLAYFAAAAVAATFAATSHPSGLVAFAPLLAAAGWLVAWLRVARIRVVALFTLIFAIGALGIVLFFLDSDVSLRLAAMAEFRSGSHALGPLEEPIRYLRLTVMDGGTVLRRLSVALGGLTIVLFAARAWRRPRAIVDLAAWSLIGGTVLLSITPSKWVWHFGTLVPFMAIALSIEIGSLVTARKAPARRVIAVAGVAAAATFAWGGTQESNPLDLVDLSWTDVPLTNTPFWFWMLIGAIVIAATVGYAVLRSTTMSDALASAPPIFMILVATLAILATSIVLVRDAATTEGWTYALQNGQTLIGRTSCGLADSMDASSSVGAQHLAVVDPDTAVADRKAAEQGFPIGAGFHAGWYRTAENIENPAGLLGLLAYGSLPPEPYPNPRDYQASSFGPWQRLTPSDETVYLRAAGGRRNGTRLGVQFGHLVDGSVAPTGLEKIEMGPYTFVWHSLEVAVPQGSDVARVVAVDEASGFGGWLAYTELFDIGEPDLDLAATMADPSTVTLVPPPFLTYFPCATLPSITNGVADIPDIIVSGVQPKDVFAPVEYQREYRAVSAYPLVIFVDANSEVVNREISE